MAAKKRVEPSVKVIVEKAMPGWTVVQTAAADKVEKSVVEAGDRRAGSKGLADAVSPSVRTIKETLRGAKGRRGKRVKVTAYGTTHGQFITIRPLGSADSSGRDEKVVLIRDGKVVARQG